MEFPNLPEQSHVSLGFIPTATKAAEQRQKGWKEAPGSGKERIKGTPKIMLSPESYYQSPSLHSSAGFFSWNM